MAFKENVIAACFALLEEKINSLKKIMIELEEGSQNDSKSSAGDKHETARAMMQIEQEKISRQLGELLEQKSVLKTKGVLLKTDKGFLFLSIPLGKVLVGGNTVIVISPKSPLGIKLSHARAGEKVSVNGTDYLIEKVE